LSAGLVAGSISPQTAKERVGAGYRVSTCGAIAARRKGPPALTRVLILAEIGVYREALSQSLGSDERFDVVGVAAGPEEAVTAVDEVGPEIVLVDMPTPAGADAVRTLVAAAPEIQVIALAIPEVERDVIAFAEAGASGYVAREGSIDDLVAAVESVARGECLLSPEIAAKLVRRVATLAREPRLEPIDERLTARELDVLRLIDEGLSNKEIAKALSIELPTVKNHVHSILEKLNVRRRTAAAARARRRGLLGGAGPGRTTELNAPRVKDPDP
jgi:two-component system nitrate/nitrite response regulator NarL